MKKLILFLSMVGLLISVSTSSILAQDTGWTIKRFHSDIAIQSSGEVEIKEQIVVDFGSLQKHGIYRDIPYAYKNDDGSTYYTEIMVETVTRNQQPEPYEVTHNDSNIRIKIGDADITHDGPQIYDVSYRAVGVLRPFDGYDELYWNVTGNEWEVPIEQASALVTLPGGEVIQSSCYQGVVGSTQSCTKVVVSEQDTQFEATSALTPGDGLTVAVGYTQGLVPILTGAKPKSPIDYVLMPKNLSGFSALLVVGLVGVVMVWWKRGRDKWWSSPAALEANQQASDKPLGGKETVVVEYTPPDNLPPGLLGLIKDQSADTLDVTSSIIDLAARGFLTITELNKTWILGAKDYQLKQLDKSTDGLYAYEKLLLDKLFGTGNEVKLSSLTNTFYTDLEKIKQKLYADAIKLGWFVDDPDGTRKKYMVLGLICGIASVVGAISLLSAQHYFLGMSLIATTVIGFALVALSPFMSRRSALGREMYRRVRGYELFISTAEKYRQRFFEQQNLFNQVLPYAMMFGLTAKFAQAMKTIEYTPPQPSWYFGLHAFNPISFGQDIEGVSKAMSTTMASSPSSSGSGGGGSSGGGFGGGGGGSW